MDNKCNCFSSDDESNSGSGSQFNGHSQYDWFKGWWLSPYDHGMVQGKQMSDKVRGQATTNSGSFWQGTNQGFTYQ